MFYILLPQNDCGHKTCVLQNKFKNTIINKKKKTKCYYKNWLSVKWLMVIKFNGVLNKLHRKSLVK